MIGRASSMGHIHGLNESPVVVVVVPLPAQGHLNQLLNFSRLISGKGIPVHYIGAAVHNRQAKHRVHGWDPSSIPNIHFHDYPLPPFETPPPDPHASHKFPTHLAPTFEASLHLCAPVSQLLHSLSSTARRVVVVHDTLMSFAAKEASLIPNCEAYSFHSVSSFAILFYKWESLGKPETILIPTDLPNLSVEGAFPERFAEFLKEQYQLMKFVSGYLYNTCRPIEGTFLDLLAQEELLGNRRQWAIGPLNPLAVHTNKCSIRHHKCLEWLDKQPLDSVIYISFGTMTSMTDKQIHELSFGLERSEQRFIWVLRDADRGDIYADEKEVRKFKLPDGYEERLEGRGMIVRDWAPQLEILAHPSTGGFLSHCGWNSCMESMSMGVPLVAWPMHSDQPRNTILLTHVLKIGLVVQEWEAREQLVSSFAIENAVRMLIVSKEGNDMRRRAKELGVSVRQSASKGGTSTAELDSFITHITR